MAHAETEVQMTVALDRVVDVVGRFEDPSWIHGVQDFAIEGEGVGAQRVLHMADGAKPMEVLQSQDAHGYAFTMPDDVPLPVVSFRSRIAVRALGEGCVVTWRSEFDADGLHPAAIARQLESLYMSSLFAVKRRLEP